jgi:hypothetical protein
MTSSGNKSDAWLNVITSCSVTTGVYIVLSHRPLTAASGNYFKPSRIPQAARFARQHMRNSHIHWRGYLFPTRSLNDLFFGKSNCRYSVHCVETGTTATETPYTWYPHMRTVPMSIKYWPLVAHIRILHLPSHQFLGSMPG